MPRGKAATFELQRAAILETAAHLFAENGFAGTSMADLAKACGVSKALLYHYYRDKEHLLFDTADSYLDTLIAVVAEVHARRPELEQAGVVYHYTGQAGTVVAGVDKQYVGYELVELSSTWWAHARSHQTFSHFRDYHGERCASSGWDCPRDVGGAVAGDADACATPWSQSPGRGVSSVKRGSGA